MKENLITLNGRDFRYLERQGDGLKFLFLHGLSDFANQFIPLSSQLPDDWHLLALDQRGHGGSWKPDEQYSPIDYADDINYFIDALSIASIHIFGHSMGGRNALVFSTENSHKVQSLILGDIGPDKNLNDIEETTSFFNSLPDSFQTEDEARLHLEGRKPYYSRENIDILMQNLEQSTNGNYVWCYSKDACIQSVTEARSRGWWKFLSMVKCPVLLLHVERSTELSDYVAMKMIDKLSNAKYSTITDSGHNFHLEQPNMAAIKIRQFIADL